MHDSNSERCQYIHISALVAYSLVEKMSCYYKINVMLKLGYMPGGWCYEACKRNVIW